MPESGTRQCVYRFGPFEADLHARQLRKHGLRMKLPSQPFQILAEFLENAGEVVSRDQLCRRLWSDGIYVEFDNSLNAAMNKLRDALGDSADHPRYVETLPRRGYRFIASIEKRPAPIVLEPVRRSEGSRVQRTGLLPAVASSSRGSNARARVSG